MDADQVALVPPRRLGSLLRQARLAAGSGLDEVAAKSEFGVVDLDDIEHGRRPVDDATVAALLSLYGIEDTGLLPARSRLVIDLDAGQIAVDQVDISVGGSADADSVLARYLALVYRLRDLPLGTQLRLRDVDLDVLSTALAIDATEVESRLQQLMRDKSVVHRDQRRLRRRMLVPLAGVVVAATAVGVLVLVSQSNDNTPVVTDTPTTLVATDLGSGGAVVDNPGTSAVSTDLGSGAAVETNTSTGSGG